MKYIDLGDYIIRIRDGHTPSNWHLDILSLYNNLGCSVDIDIEAMFQLRNMIHTCLEHSPTPITAEVKDNT